MLDKLGTSPPEIILQITADYLADTRSPKIDLGVGVYKDDTGQTPVLRAVKQVASLLRHDRQTRSRVVVDCLVRDLRLRRKDSFEDYVLMQFRFF